MVRAVFRTSAVLGLAGLAVSGLMVSGLAVALTSSHLAGAPLLLVASTVTAVLAVTGLTAQPWLARVRGNAHAAAGLVVVTLVLAHVAALLALSPDDALFAMSPDGPTRARMALTSLVLLAVVVVLGASRRRLGWSRPTFRLLHGGFALLAAVLGIGHAVLTDGALEGVGTAVLVASGVLTLTGSAAGLLSRRVPAPRASPAVPASGTGRAGGPPPPGPRSG